jgi:O-antigen/teichoic acid export membrane protein
MVLYEERDTVIRGVSWQFYSSLVSIAVGGLFYIFIIHFYNSTEIVGVFSLLSAIAYLFSTVFALGLAIGIQHFVSYHIGRGEESVIMVLVRKLLLLGLLMSSASFLSLWVLSPALSLLFFHTFSYLNYVKLLDVELFAMVFNSFLTPILLGLQNFRRSAVIGILNWAVGYGLIIPFLLTGHDPIRIIYAWIIGYYITTALLYISVHSKLRRVRATESGDAPLRPVIAYSVPIFVSGLIGYGATYVDRFTVSFFINLSELGIYNFALLVISALGILTTPIAVILLSRLSEFYSRKDTKNFRLYMEKSLEVLSAVYMPVALLAAALAPSVLLFLANPSYLPGYTPIMIILVASAITVTGTIYGTSLQAIRKTRIFVISSSLALTSNLVLSVILIPRFGIDGAAVGYASTSVVGFAVVLYYSIKHGTFTFDKVKMSKIFLSSFLMFILMIFVQERLGYSILKLAVYIVTGLAVYLFLIRVTGTFSEEDINIFLGMIPSRMDRLKRFFRSLFV